MKGKYSIIMTTDDNYVIPTKVAIYSMIQSGDKESVYEIHILCTSDLSITGRTNLLELKSRCPNVKIIFDEVNVDLLKDVSTHAYIPVASYYRLFITGFINEDKCLFIDGDTVILDDVTKLFEYDLGDSYIAAVKDCAVQNRKVDFDKHELRLGIDNLDEYVNAGVMVFNLKKIREDHMDIVFIEAIKDGYKFMDQDILNKFCLGRIIHIPLRYNLFSEYYKRVESMEKTDYSESELIEAQTNPAVIHYPGMFKPWNTRRLMVNSLWWDYARGILEVEEINNLEKKAEQFEQESDLTHIINYIVPYEKVVVFGYSDNSRWLLDRLLNVYSDKFFFFCDNDTKKQNCVYKTVEVKSPNELLSEIDDYLWIIASQNAYFQINNQLLNSGVKESCIIRYYHKDESYYARLSGEYYDFEYSMIGNI